MNPFSSEYTLDSSDSDLIACALGGNKRALDELIKRHYPFVYNVAWKMIGDPDKAADLTQEAFVKIINKLSSFNQQSAFRTWAYRIVRNHFLDDQKKPDQKFASSFEELGTRLDASGSVDLTVEEQQIKSEEIKEMRLQCLSGMLLCLTKEQRLVYIIGELFESDHNIGSEIMGVSKANYRMK
ncbi:MAG: sigma-70 family RNA polymerase sigma factor, partial [Bacteroidota bacterium]